MASGGGDGVPVGVLDAGCDVPDHGHSWLGQCCRAGDPRPQAARGATSQGSALGPVRGDFFPRRGGVRHRLPKEFLVAQAGWRRLLALRGLRDALRRLPARSIPEEEYPEGGVVQDPSRPHQALVANRQDDCYFLGDRSVYRAVRGGPDPG